MVFLFQATSLVSIITLMDLTTLSGDDTPGTVRRLCAKARQPVRPDLLEALGVVIIPAGIAIFLFEVGLVATLQAFIFATLTAIYLGGAVAEHH